MFQDFPIQTFIYRWCSNIFTLLKLPPCLHVWCISNCCTVSLRWFFCARHGMTWALRHTKDPHMFGQTHISDIKLNTRIYIYSIISVCVCVSHRIPLKMGYPSKKMEKRHVDVAFKRPRQDSAALSLAYASVGDDGCTAIARYMRENASRNSWYPLNVHRAVEVYRNHN